MIGPNISEIRKKRKSHAFAHDRTQIAGQPPSEPAILRRTGVSCEINTGKTIQGGKGNHENREKSEIVKASLAGLAGLALSKPIITRNSYYIITIYLQVYRYNHHLQLSIYLPTYLYRLSHHVHATQTRSRLVWPFWEQSRLQTAVVPARKLE